MNKITFLLVLFLSGLVLPICSQKPITLDVSQSNASVHTISLVKIQRVTFQGRILFITTSEGVFQLPLNDINYIAFGKGDNAVENVEVNTTRITLLGDELHIESEHGIRNLYLVDMTGKVLIHKKLSSLSEATITLPQTGAWVLFLDTTQGYVAKKIIKK
jgi:hypothetical protein